MKTIIPLSQKYKSHCRLILSIITLFEMVPACSVTLNTVSASSFYFLHHGEFLNSHWALCCVVTFHVSSQKERPWRIWRAQFKTRTQQSCQQLQGYLFILQCEMTAATSLSAHVAVPVMRIDSFVTCSQVCERLCWKKGWIGSLPK